MQYAIHYDKLMRRGLARNPTPDMERHHILPRSLGGSDEASNLVHLTVREHFLAHLLLWKMGYSNQLWSVEAMLADCVNPRRTRRYKVLRYKRWLRRNITIQRAIAHREKVRENRTRTSNA